MKWVAAIAAFCLALAPMACGGDESATGAGGAETSVEKQGEPDPGSTDNVAGNTELPPIGSYPQEGPFSGISGGKGDSQPVFDPPHRPPPTNPFVRDLESGSGPAAKVGDEITAYYIGAIYESGKVQLYGWPPAPPMTFELGSGTDPRLWKLGFVGLREGGIREVVAPSRFFGGTGAYDYVMVLLDVNPASGDT